MEQQSGEVCDRDLATGFFQPGLTFPKRLKQFIAELSLFVRGQILCIEVTHLSAVVLPGVFNSLEALLKFLRSRLDRLHSAEIKHGHIATPGRRNHPGKIVRLDLGPLRAFYHREVTQFGPGQMNEHCIGLQSLSDHIELYKSGRGGRSHGDKADPSSEICLPVDQPRELGAIFLFALLSLS